MIDPIAMLEKHPAQATQSISREDAKKTDLKEKDNSLEHNKPNEEMFEKQVRGLIYTSIEDARSSLNFVTKEIMVEALKREKEGEHPRSSMIKMIEAAIRKERK